jgi:hypothetical protein
MKKKTITIAEFINKGFDVMDPDGPTYIVDGKRSTHVLLPFRLFENILEEIEDLEEKVAALEYP